MTKFPPRHVHSLIVVKIYLHSFNTTNANTNISFLDHANIISTIPYAQCSLARPNLDQPSYLHTNRWVGTWYVRC